MRQDFACGLAVLLLCVSGGAELQESDAQRIPGAVPLTIGTPVTIQNGLQSAPITVENRDVTIVRLGQGRFSLDDQSRLTASFNVAVSHCTNTEYWIHAAVFDRNGKLLGTSSHRIAVSDIRLPVSPCIIHELEFDFGVSARFGVATQLALSIGER